MLQKSINHGQSVQSDASSNKTNKQKKYIETLLGHLYKIQMISLFVLYRQIDRLFISIAAE